MGRAACRPLSPLRNRITLILMVDPGLVLTKPHLGRGVLLSFTHSQSGSWTAAVSGCWGAAHGRVRAVWGVGAEAERAGGVGDQENWGWAGWLAVG